MIIPSANYTFDASAKTLTLTSPYNTTSQEQIVTIRNLTKNIWIYDCTNTGRGNITVSEGVVTFDYSATMEDTDIIQIKIDTGVDGGTP